MTDRYISYIQVVLDKARADGVDPRDILLEMMDNLPEEEAPEKDPMHVAIREAGFTVAALSLPRSDLHFNMLCGYNGANPSAAPRGWRFYPNEADKAAWGRVEATCRSLVSDGRQTEDRAWERLYWAWRNQAAAPLENEHKSLSKMWGRVLAAFLET